MVILLCFALSGGINNLYYSILYPTMYDESVEKYSGMYGIPTSLAYAVIRTESSFRPDAVSSVGARGLMQITEDTFEWAAYRMGDETTIYDDLFTPDTNIKFGIYILSLLKDEFVTDAEVLAAYHAGWGSVKGWLSDDTLSDDGETIHTIPFQQTANYVPKVLESAEIYKNVHGLL